MNRSLQINLPIVDSDTMGDIIKLILEMMITANNNGFAIESAMIDSNIVYDSRGFIGELRGGK